MEEEWNKYMETARYFPQTTNKYHWENGFRSGEKRTLKKLGSAFKKIIKPEDLSCLVKIIEDALNEDLDKDRYET